MMAWADIRLGHPFSGESRNPERQQSNIATGFRLSPENELRCKTPRH
jgi:hypothetical protein